MDQRNAQRFPASRKAEDRIASAISRDAAIRKEIETERAKSAAKTARLRALRLAKEAADRVEAEKQGPAATAVKSVRPKMRRTPGQ